MAEPLFVVHETGRSWDGASRPSMTSDTTTERATDGPSLVTLTE